MATLVLGTVGRVLGGPFGGLAGTLIGSTIDRGLFGGGTVREGPRVANLAVQSAAYGEPLPHLYGRMRIAGNLIWTTGIKESRQRSGGGKRGPATSSYSYSSSFAVIVSARPITRIGRIWADGKLLRTADGQLIYPATIRTYRGGEAQAADPLIAAAEGMDAAPAYRDRAYVVFEDLPLADYGNRIPNLTFEVIADDRPVGVAEIAVDIARGGVAAYGEGATVVGFAAAQTGSVRAVLAQLTDFADLALRDDGAALIIGPATAAVTVASLDLGAAANSAAAIARHETRESEAAVPDMMTLGYFDPARDFQSGVQRAVRRTPSLRSSQRDLAVALGAGDAKALAETLLRRAIAARSKATVNVPWRYAAVRPGDAILLSPDARPWRVSHRTITGAVVELGLERLADGAGVVATAVDGGRAFDAGDAPQGSTTLHILDLPPLPGALPVAPRLLLAAAGAGSGWRRADVLMSRDGGGSYTLATTIAAPAVMGITTSALAVGNRDRWDRVSSVDVELLGASMELVSAPLAAVLDGANLALVGNEILQFADAVQTGARRWRLTTLLRGRRGTEADVVDHPAGDRFVLLDDRLAAVDMAAEAVGAPTVFKAVGAGEDPAAQPGGQIVPAGVALRPLAPTALVLTPAADNGIRTAWRRRSRGGFVWADGTDVPLAEDSERYRIQVRRGDRVVREVDVTVPEWTYDAVSRAADATPAGALTIAVAQVSAAVGAGRYATIAL